MSPIEPSVIGSVRARVYGWAGVTMALLALTSVVLSAIPPVTWQQMIVGSALLLSAISGSIEGFGNRIDIDDSGLTGRRGWNFARPRIAWSDIRMIDQVGDGSFFRPSKVVARLTSGESVTLLTHGIDADAAASTIETIRRQLARYRLPRSVA